MSTTKYIITAAGLAAGTAAGNAVAAPTLVSAAPAGYTGATYDGTKSGTLGSFDTSGAGLNTINVSGYFNSDSPKVYLSSSNAGSSIATSTRSYGTSGFTDTFANAYSSLPDNFAASTSTTSYANLTKEGASNFSSTPMFGMTQYANASGGLSNGYFKGTSSGNTFTLLDYGTIVADNAAPAVPEPSVWAMLAVGIGGVGAVLRRRRNAAASAGMTAAAA